MSIHKPDRTVAPGSPGSPGSRPRSRRVPRATRSPRVRRRLAPALLGAVAAALALGTLLAPSGPLRAERPILHEAAKQAESTHALIGKVIGLYRKTSPKRDDRIETLVEIEVREVEKGDGIAEGDLVYARVWRRAERRGLFGMVPPPPGPAGHVPIPAVGDVVRAWLARGDYPATRQKDRGYAVLYPNGIEVLPSDR